MNSGIYQIRNLNNDKVYIGSAIDFNKRKITHFSQLRLNKHINRHLQYSYNKHGNEAFVFEIIEYVDDINDLISREQYYIDNSSNALYNIRTKAESNLGIRHTEYSKRNIVAANNRRRGTKRGPTSEETKRKIGLANKGRKPSDYTIQRMIESKKGVPISDQHRAKLSKPVYQINIKDGTVINKYNSIREASSITNITNSNISKTCLGQRKSAGGFYWRYV